MHRSIQSWRAWPCGAPTAPAFPQRFSGEWNQMNNHSPQRPLFLALVLTVALLTACRESGNEALDAFYSTATVTRGAIAEVVQMAGQVTAVNARQLTMGTIGGRVIEVLVGTGQEVEQGQALLRLNTSEVERRLREAEADLTVAEAGLAAAQGQAGGIELAEAEAELAEAAYELATAELELKLAEQLGLAPLREAVDDAEYAVQVARDQQRLAELGSGGPTIRSLEYDLSFYQRTLRDIRPDDAKRPEVEKKLADTDRELRRARAAREDSLRAAAEEVEKREIELARAQTSLARAVSGDEDPANVARLAYDQALAQYEKAQQEVEELRAGGEGEALRAARTAYEAALALVESAEADLDAATLRAPFDGAVIAVHVQPGSSVQPSDAVLFLADPRDLRIQAQVSEVDIPRLMVGQAVRITFDAYPGQIYGGEVLSLPPGGSPQGGLSFYAVETSLHAAGSDLRLGMMGNVRVVIGERQGVLTVPAAALVYRTPEEIVVKVRDASGGTREQQVEIGLNDGILAEVLSGLSEGQTVLVPLVPPSDQFWYGPGGGILK